MRYSVEIEGEVTEVEVREGASGLEVGVVGAEGEVDFAPASLTGTPEPLYQLAWGTRQVALRVEPDLLEPENVNVSLPGQPPRSVCAKDARTLSASAGRAESKAKGPWTLRSAMPGVIVEVRVSEGETVAVGQVLLILEAMKMQNEIKALRAGVVTKVDVGAADSVPAGAPLVSFAPCED